MNNLRKYLLLAAGIFFILLGLVGLVLPFLQGILFLIIGIVLLSFYSPRIRTQVEKYTARYPKIQRIFEKAEHFVERVFGLSKENDK